MKFYRINMFLLFLIGVAQGCRDVTYLDPAYSTAEFTSHPGFPYSDYSENNMDFTRKDTSSMNFTGGRLPSYGLWRVLVIRLSNMDSCWHLHSVPSYYLRLTPQSFQLEDHSDCSYDKLTLSNDGYELGVFCGQSIFTELTFTSCNLTLRMTSDGSGSYDGFRMRYEYLPVTEEVVNSCYTLIDSYATTTLAYTTASEDQGLSTAATVGMGIGVFVLAVIVIMWLRKRKAQQRNRKPPPQATSADQAAASTPYSAPTPAPEPAPAPYPASSTGPTPFVPYPPVILDTPVDSLPPPPSYESVVNNPLHYNPPAYPYGK